MLSSNHSAIHVESMTSSWSPGYFRVVESFKCDIGLGSTSQDVSFVESVEFSHRSLLEYKERQVIDALGGKHEGKNLSNPRDDFGLLGLII